MQQYQVRELRKNLSTILNELPVEVINGRTGEVIAVIQQPDFVKVNKPIPVVQKNIPGANKAMQNFMAKNTMLKTTEAKQKPTDKVCELPYCKKSAVAQGTWVEYDMETGERTLTLWLCQEHLDKGKRNAANV